MTRSKCTATYQWKPKGECLPVDKELGHATAPKNAGVNSRTSTPHLQRQIKQVRQILKKSSRQSWAPSSEFEAEEIGNERWSTSEYTSEHVSPHVELQLRRIKAHLKDACSDHEGQQAACWRSASSTDCDGSGAENSSDFEEWESISLLPIPPPPPLPPPPSPPQRRMERMEKLMQRLLYSGRDADDEQKPWNGNRHWQTRSDASADQMRSLKVEAMLSSVLFKETDKQGRCIKTGSNTDWLARCIPRQRDLACVQRCLQELNAVVKTFGQSWRVQPFGSYGNGLALVGSDLDAACLTPESFGEDPGGASALHILTDVLYPALSKHPQFTVVEQVLKARVPILKLRFDGGLDVDLSCHNVKPIQNTSLIRAYVQMHTKVRDLILAVKTWTKVADVCGAANWKLSTYAFSLMVLFFLQVDPMIQLPCLPTTAFELNTDRPPGLLTPSWSCKMPVSVLLARFFRFYSSQFDWGVHVVSVRLGRMVSKDDPIVSSLAFRSTNRIHIEDPFDLRRNLHCVLGANEEVELQAAFRQAFAIVESLGARMELPESLSEWNVLNIISESEGRYVKAGYGLKPQLRSGDQFEDASSRIHQDHSSHASQDGQAIVATPAKSTAQEFYDACWFFCFIGGCFGYTMYAMYCGELFRLVIAVLGLFAVLATVDSSCIPSAKRAEQSATATGDIWRIGKRRESSRQRSSRRYFTRFCVALR